MTILLLVRSAGTLRSAVEAANALLVYERQRVAEPPEADEVIGIWLRRELDADLPTWRWRNRGFGAGVSVDVPGAATRNGPGKAGVGVRESFSLSGSWTLCWIDGTFVRTAHSAAERRRISLDALLGNAYASPSRSAAEAFFPVFAAADALESIAASMLEIHDRYPQIIAGTWFVDDPERGIVPVQEAGG